MLTVVALAVVGAVVVIASLIAARDDVQRATPAPAPSPSRIVATASPPTMDRIEFATTTGSGVLEIVDHGWDSDGSDPAAPGSLLTVAVKVSCESGVVRYGPDSFQAFDSDGELFDPEYLPDYTTALEVGMLSAGQQVTGTVAFDIPRGGVTLLMSDEGARTVTAIRIPG